MLTNGFQSDSCHKRIRDVVQPGRALAWGARSRRFESSRPDQLKIPTLTGRYFLCLKYQKLTTNKIQNIVQLTN